LNKKSANNSNNSTVYTICFADFLINTARGSSYPLSCRYRRGHGKINLKSIIVAVRPIRYRLRL
ncbi:MAG: hypothetical protein ACK55Z_33470, partial [bacterium]